MNNCPLQWFKSGDPMTVKPNERATTAFTVCITRYNNKTWAERIAWLAVNPEYACIYK